MESESLKVTLRIARAELEQNRLLQGALHAYLGNIYRVRFGERRDELIKEAEAISVGFTSYVVADEFVREHIVGAVPTEYAVLVGDPAYYYYFDSGWPLKYDQFLRPADLVRSGVYHLNGDRESWDRALAELSQKPEFRISSIEDLGAAVYEANPQVLGAIGVHEAVLTKPLLRGSFERRGSKEQLNMITGRWESPS